MVNNTKVTSFVNKVKSLITSHNSNSDAHSTLFAAKSDTGHTHTKSEVTDFPTSMTPSSHRSTATTYGVGNDSYYGHCRCVNSLRKMTHTDGYSLSEYQGYVLKTAVDGKINTTDISTGISSSSTDSEVSSAKAVYSYVETIIGDVEDYI